MRVPISAPLIQTLTWLELANVVAREAPLTWIAVVGTNPEPVTVIVADAVPVGELS
jgi:hypothetical protein